MALGDMVLVGKRWVRPEHIVLISELKDPMPSRFDRKLLLTHVVDVDLPQCEAWRPSRIWLSEKEYEKLVTQMQLIDPTQLTRKNKFRPKKNTGVDFDHN